jgi:indolepyruvate ferredoxin oxidoreductase beta subunit
MPNAPAAPETVPATRATTVAILAMGGEGGGVLADWLVDAAEASDFIAQSTSVPGVAQRTGATIYYLEFFPAAEARAAGQEPVLALMPAPGEVDVVVASELMEAGRAVQRGLMSPERGTFILSTHRVFAMTEKIAMGDGRVDAAALLRTCQSAARRVVAADMQALAETAGAHLSAVLLGAVAGSGALFIPRAAFEEAIRRAGVGVEASLRGFAAGFDAARQPIALPSPPRAERKPETGWIIEEGIRRLTDYQDEAYANLYRERLDRLRLDGALRDETARHLALWMSYEDTIRVADLKTRASRLARVRAEVRARAEQVLRITEFMHPRPQEIADTLPAALGWWVLRARAPRRVLELLTARGRHVETTSVSGFLLLRGIAALRPFRRRTLRYAEEQARIEAWLARIGALAAREPDLALEVARCQRLVKGYGETHARGWANFQRLMAEADRLAGDPGAAARLASLRAAALADEDGQALAKSLEAA